MRMLRKWALAIVVLFGSVALAHADGLEQTHQTVPSASFSFLPDLQNFLKREDANRYADLFSSSIVSGGIHTTSAGLTATPDAMTAYLGGVYTTEDASITYPDNSTCWVMAHTSMSGNLGSFVRVPNTHYLLNCGSLSQPTLPDSASAWLLTVTTSGGAVTAVQDIRAQGALQFDACRYATLNAAINAIAARPTYLDIACPLSVTTSVTVPPNIILSPRPNTHITIDGSVVLSFTTPDQIPLSTNWRLFYGTSTAPISFLNSGVIRPEWWGGGRTTSAANNTIYFQRAIRSFTVDNTLGWLLLQPGNYAHDNSLVTDSRNIGIRGAGRDSTSLILTTAASNRHGFYCTGTTQHISAVGIMFRAVPAQTDDYTQTAFRCDGVGDAPLMPADSTYRVDDAGCVGYNICFFGDGGAAIHLNIFEVSNITITGSGSGSTSAVNEGVNCLRALVCRGHNWHIFGNHLMDHALYALGNLIVDVDHIYVTQTLNEAIKLISVPGSIGTQPNYYKWRVTNGTYHDVFGTHVVKVDQNFTLDSLDLSGTTIVGDSGSRGLTNAAILLEVADASVIRRVDMSRLTASALQKGVVTVTGSSTGAFSWIDATQWSIYDWSINTPDTYAVFRETQTGTPSFGVLQYSGIYDGNNHGRSVFAVGTRNVFTLAQSLGVVETRVAVPDIHPQLVRFGYGTDYYTVGGNLYCTTTQIGTDANTTEKNLADYTIAAGALNSNTSGIKIRAWGTTAANGNTKTIRLKIGGVTTDSNNVTTAPNNLDWQLETQAHRVGATDLTISTTMAVGTNFQGTNTFYQTVALDNSIQLLLTGQNGTSSTNDIVLRGFCVDALPN